MKDKNQAQGKEYRLRKRAEESLAEKPENLDGLSTTDIRAIIHELHVHKIELEMQNEELRRTQLELEESRNKYADLYDFAPAGYFTLSEKGLILEVNLTGANLLGVERKYLINRLFPHRIAGDNRDVFYSYRKQLLETAARQTCELKMSREDGASFYVQLEGIAVFGSDGSLSHFRMVMLDITERKAREALKESFTQLSKKNRYETIISTVTRSVHQTINFQEVLENAVDAMSKNIDRADNVAIYLVEGEKAVMKAYRGYSDRYIERAGRIPSPKGFTWKTIIEEKPRYCADVDSDTVIGPAGRDLGTKSYASMPIQFEGKAVGAIDINSFQKNAFDEEELRLLEIVARQIETAINNAQKAEVLYQAKEELELRVRERTQELSETNEELKKEIAWHKQAEKQIKASLEEKEVLLKEIHHRVKNNLQVISSLISLQADYAKEKQTIEMFNEIQNRVQAMALIHETLYQSKDLSRIDFGEYVRNMGVYLFQSYGAMSNHIKLKIDVDNVLLDIDTAITCGLIISELASNSLKHAFPERKKGEICIALHPGNGKSDSPSRPYTLIVSDNGVGFPKDLDFQSTKSLGLQLVVTLVKKLKSVIELDRSGGTAFKIRF